MKLILPKKKNFDIKFSFFLVIEIQSINIFLSHPNVFQCLSLSPLLNLKTKILN